MSGIRGERAASTGRLVGAAGALASCLPMVAMLPGGFAAVLGFVGLGASSAVVRALDPALSTIAQPLLLVSVALVAVSGLRCIRTAVLSALAGGALLYLSMYVLTRGDGTAAPALFYPGFAFFLASYALSFATRRQLRCRPLVGPRAGRRLLAATLVLGAIAVTASAALGETSKTRHHPQTMAPMDGEQMPMAPLHRCPCQRPLAPERLPVAGNRPFPATTPSAAPVRMRRWPPPALRATRAFPATSRLRTCRRRSTRSSPSPT